MRFVVILDPAISVNESDPNTENSVASYPPFDNGIEQER